MSQIGQRAWAIRLMRDESRETVARRADISFTTYWRIETGRNEPSVETLLAIAEALEVDLEQLVGAA